MLFSLSTHCDNYTYTREIYIHAGVAQFRGNFAVAISTGTMLPGYYHCLFHTIDTFLPLSKLLTISSNYEFESSASVAYYTLALRPIMRETLKVVYRVIIINESAELRALLKVLSE